MSFAFALLTALARTGDDDTDDDKDASDVDDDDSGDEDEDTDESDESNDSFDQVEDHIRGGGVCGATSTWQYLEVSFVPTRRAVS